MCSWEGLEWMGQTVMVPEIRGGGVWALYRIELMADGWRLLPLRSHSLADQAETQEVVTEERG